MTVWVLRQTLDADEEARIFERTELRLPFDGLPDLTQVSNAQEARRLLALLHPDEPPEATARRVERFWHRFSTLQLEDVIAVPLPLSRKLALATVVGHYRYETAADGGDIHLIPVRWHEKFIPLTKFSKHKELFDPANPPMYEVDSAEARASLREQLPHGYNRFAKWKWLMALFFALSLLRMLQGMVG